MEMLPHLFDVKDALEKCIPSLQGSICAQKQRLHRKLTEENVYTLFASNSHGLTWETAVLKIGELQNIGFNDKIFCPLSAEQLLAFSDLKDNCHRIGYYCVPAEALSKQYGLNNVDEVQFTSWLRCFPFLELNVGNSMYSNLVFKQYSNLEELRSPIIRVLSTIENLGHVPCRLNTLNW